MPASFWPQLDSQLCFYGNLSHQRITLGLSTLQSLLNQSKSSRRSLQFTVMSFYFCSISVECELQSQPLPAKSNAQPYDLQQNIDRPSAVNLKEGRGSWFRSISNIKCGKSAICNYRLTLHCLLVCFFLVFLPQTFSSKHIHPDTKIDLHHRCFYLLPTNFFLNSTSMYNAFEGYWIGFFPLLLLLFLVCTVLHNLLPSSQSSLRKNVLLPLLTF